MTINYQIIERQVAESIDRALIHQSEELMKAEITEVLANNSEVQAGLTKIIARLIQRTLVHIDQQEAT